MRIISRLFLLVIFTMIAWTASADYGDSVAAASPRPGRTGLHMKFELKREATDRGSTDETTKSSFKCDFLLPGVVSLLRLEIPFPDEKTDFQGDALKARLGDIKTRIGFRLLSRPGMGLSSFVELTWPTASPSNLGSGKYQASAGIRVGVPLWRNGIGLKRHRASFDAQVQQVVSYAGKEDRKDINYTKFEITLKDTWKKLIWLKLTAKPVVNWEKKGNTGSVAELEFGWIISRHFSLWLMGGRLLWGEGIPGTYDNRLSLGASYQF